MKPQKPIKHKQSKYFTLMLIPYSSQKTKSIRIPHSLLHLCGFVIWLTGLVLVLFYLQTNHLKNVALTKEQQLIQEIEEKNEKSLDIQRQKEYYQKQQAEYKKTIDSYEKELKLYEEKAAEIDSKIRALDQSKKDIVDILSDKVGFRPDIQLSSLEEPNIVSSMSTGGFTFLSSSAGVPNQATFLASEQLGDLSITYATLEKELQTEIKDYDQLRSQVQKYKPMIDALPNIWPVRGTITSTFSSRSNPFTGSGTEFHSGLDIKASTGTPVKVTGGGKVTFSGWQNGYGNVVIVDHGYGYSTLYGHNSKLAVSVGDTVKRGDIISYAGSTGRSTGPHVHYEVRINGQPKDPMNYIKK